MLDLPHSPSLSEEHRQETFQELNRSPLFLLFLPFYDSAGLSPSLFVLATVYIFCVVSLATVVILPKQEAHLDFFPSNAGLKPGESWNKYE